MIPCNTLESGVSNLHQPKVSALDTTFWSGLLDDTLLQVMALTHPIQVLE